MKNAITLFLKVAIILIGIPILALCIFLVPNLANFAAKSYPNIVSIKYLVFIVMYGAAIPFYFALHQAFNLLRCVDESKAFSQLSVDGLKKIKYCAIAISSLYLLGSPLFYLMAKKIDPPGIAPIGLVIAFASMAVAVFTAVLQKLLKEAIDIKSENDLTV